MASQTWAELVNLTLRDSGVAAAGQTPSAQMQNDCKLRLNMMIGQWKRRRWLVYQLLDVFCACDGSQSYGVGPGQPLNTPRTDQIEAAFIRQVIPSSPTPVDFPLRVLSSREEYSRITLKTLAAAPPDCLWFDAGFPTGLVYPWPLPSSAWQLHIVVKGILNSVDNLTDDTGMPDEYQEAIYANLYIRLCSAFRLPQDKMIVKMAKKGMQTIRASNAQIPVMTMPQGLTRGRSYNPYSDR